MAGKRSALLAGLIALIVLPQAAAAQRLSADSATVEGQVVDAQSGSPLPATLVRVLELGRQDLTHGDGEFHLINLPAGRFTLVVERLGYRRHVQAITLARGQTLELRIALQASAIELPGFVVTGTIAPRLGDETVRPTTVLAGKKLSRSLDATVAGTLRNEPGLAMASMGPATGRPVIRGLGGDRVLILEDGARTGDLSATGSDHAVSVDPINALRMEVVRGPAALLYGSNAIGGVVNVIRQEIPTSLPDRATGSVSMQAQSANRGVAAGGSAETTSGTLSLRAEGSIRDAGDLRAPDSRLVNSWMRSHSVAVGGSRVEPWGHAGVSYRFLDSSYGIPAFEQGHAEGVEIEMKRHVVNLDSRIRLDAGPFRALETRAGYVRYHHRELEDEGIVGTEFGLLTSSAEVVARNDSFGPFSGGAVGARVQWQDYASIGVGTPPVNEWWLAGFLLQELELNRFSLQFGGRYDWHRVLPRNGETRFDIGDIRARSFGSVSGSMGGLYALGSGLHLGASVARAYRTPGITELFSDGPHLAAFSYEIGNPELAAETGLGLDITLRLTRDEVHGEVAAFRNRLNNYIYYQRTEETSPGGLPVYRASGTDAVMTGVEASIEWNVLRNVVVDGVISHVRGTNLTEDRPLPFIPPLSGTLGTRYDRPSWFVGGQWRWSSAQDRVGEFEQPTAGYNVFDADAGVRLVALGRIHTLTVRGENLTDVLHRDHLSRVKAIMPQPGRNVSLVYRLAY
jgi:iron complex outermembrane recepter protein